MDSSISLFLLLFHRQSRHIHVVLSMLPVHATVFNCPLSADPLLTGTRKISSPGATDDFSLQDSNLPLWRQSRDEFWLEMRPGPPLSFWNDLRYLPHLESPTLVKPQSLQSYKQPHRFRLSLFYFGGEIDEVQRALSPQCLKLWYPMTGICWLQHVGSCSVSRKQIALL